MLQERLPREQTNPLVILSFQIKSSCKDIPKEKIIAFLQKYKDQFEDFNTCVDIAWHLLLTELIPEPYETIETLVEAVKNFE